MTNPNPHPQAGTTAKVKESVHQLGGSEVVVEDFWDRIADKSWMDCNGNPACLEYSMRSAFSGVPIDNNVIYGKIGGIGVLLHASEIEVQS